MHPFGMRAGQADDAVKPRQQRQSPRDLGFFAAHHIGGLVLGDAGDDVDVQVKDRLARRRAIELSDH